MKNEFCHIYKHISGVYIELLSPFEEPTKEFREAMANQWYTFMDAGPNLLLRDN